MWRLVAVVVASGRPLAGLGDESPPPLGLALPGYPRESPGKADTGSDTPVRTARTAGSEQRGSPAGGRSRRTRAGHSWERTGRRTMEPNRLLSPNPMNPTRMGRPSLGSPRAAQNATAAAYNPGGTSIGRHLPLAGENTPIRGTNRHTQRGWKPKDCPFSQLHRQFVRSPVATPGTRYRRNRADTDGSPIPAPASGTLPAPG